MRGGGILTVEINTNEFTLTTMNYLNHVTRKHRHICLIRRAVRTSVKALLATAFPQLRRHVFPAKLTPTDSLHCDWSKKMRQHHHVSFGTISRRNAEADLKQDVLTGLLRAERKVPPNPEVRVAVGFGACQDVIADGLQTLHKLDARPPAEPAHFDEILDQQELEKVFAYFFRHGAAAERYLKNGKLFDKLVESALTLEGSRKALGGNAPVMASRFHKEGLTVLLASTVSPELKQEIDKEIKVVGPLLEKDDIHLLLEYDSGATWGKYSSPRANRFIVHNDVNNPYLRSLEAFVEAVLTFSPSLLVVSGLQMMDNFPFLKGERQARLEALQDFIKIVPEKTLMHFELASFAEESCFRDVVDKVVFHMDSLGMNEQELPNLHSILTNGSVTLISDPYPRIATTLDHMRAVYNILRHQAVGPSQRQVTRLHVHTLAYQAILTTRGSAWKNTMSATAKASLTANRHVCGSNYIYTEKARILMDDSFATSRESGSRIPFKADRPVACWHEGDFEICIAPNLVCTDIVQTGGGGDNISSAGLVLQI